MVITIDRHDCAFIKNQIMVFVKGLTPIWIFLIFTFAMHLFLTKGGTRLIEIAFISIDTAGILEGFI